MQLVWQEGFLLSSVELRVGNGELRVGKASSESEKRVASQKKRVASQITILWLTVVNL